MEALSPGKNEIKWFYGITLSILAVALTCLTQEFYWIGALPLVLGILYLAVFSLDTILLIITFCTPLAITLNDKSSGPALSLPTEPLMFGVLLLFLFKFTFEGKFDKRILFHPVSVSIYILLCWMGITTLTSSFPLVSLKHMISQMWFIIPFYFLGTQLFRKEKNISRFLWLYLGSLLIVVTYTIIHHAQNS